jgi:dihydroxy-acid dehydratase
MRKTITDYPHMNSRQVPEDSYYERRMLFKAMNFDDEDLNRPFVAIANSWNEFVPGHYHLRRLAEAVKIGVWQAGGMPIEFNHIAACDGLADGNIGMHWILPSRDIIAAAIEMMVQSQRVDGIVALSTCDKIVPAQLMALTRINLPAIMVTGGAMLSGKFKGRKIQAQHINEMYPDWREGKLTDLEYKEVEDDACPTCGACCTMGTANTMCCMTEALGMSLPGNGSALSVNSALYRLARRAGRKIMDLIVQDIRPRQIITPESVENAMMVHSAIGGSTNAVIHIPAILNEIEVEIPLNRWNEISAKVPHLVNTTAGSDYTIEDFGTAGGVQAVMLELKEKLHLNVMTCTGSILADNLNKAQNRNPDVIRSLDKPICQEGAIAILTGNLAPNGAVVKQTAVTQKMLVHQGLAKVYDGEDDAKEALLSGKIQPGDVVVIRYEGPKGGPGMREMYTFQTIICGMGLDDSVALVTDGRFSGWNRGPAIGHISPEAADHGPIAAVRDGDIISYNIPKRTIKLEVSGLEIDERLKVLKPFKPRITGGFLGKVYSVLVDSVDRGAVLKCKPNDSL